MRVIKRGDADNVLPFPPRMRYVEPAEALLLDRLAENNRRQLEENKKHRRDCIEGAIMLAVAFVVGVVGGYVLHWWLA